jgi:hypothetical protein
LIFLVRNLYPKVVVQLYDFNISGTAEKQTWDKVRSQLERIEAVDEQCNHCNALPISDQQENCGGVGGVWVDRDGT